MKSRRSQAELVSAGGTEILDDDIALLGKRMKQLDSYALSQVESYAALVPIARKIISAERTCKRRAPRPGLIAGARPLDFNHLGAQICQDLTAKRTGQYARSINNAYPVQGWSFLRRHGSSSLAWRLALF